MILFDLCAIIRLMVNNVGKLTRSVRESFLKNGNGTRETSATAAAKRIRQELHQTGKSIFVDDKGNRFLIERQS